MSPASPFDRGPVRPALLLLSLLSVATCAKGPSGPEIRAVAISPAPGLAVGIGSTVRFSAYTLDARGSRRYAAVADWSVGPGGVATIDGAGVATALAEGTTTVTATVAGISETVPLEVYVPEVVEDFAPGTTYRGRHGYVEYIPGELPVILAAPHGGDVTPAEIPDRTWGVTGSDRNTVELTLAVRDAFVDATGHAPHVVLSRLHRVKLDANREIDEAAQGSAFAENAWREFHGFIEEARITVTEDFGGGMYFDMHGHGHAKDRLELGYLLSPSRLNGTDASLNELAIVQMTSIREIGRTRADIFAEVLRGATSLGGLLEAEGVPALPSPGDPRPLDDPYLTGGYNIRRHGSFDDTQLVSAIQIEHHFPGVRDTDQNRRAYAGALAVAVEAYLLEYFGVFEPPP